MTKLELINRVKLKMNELTPEDNSGVSSSLEQNPIYAIINGIIDETIIEFLKTVPLRLLDASDISADKIDKKVGVSEIEKPDDFVKLVAIKFSEWERIVYTSYPVESNKHQEQLNPYTRGKQVKPIIIEAPTKFLCYSTTNTTKTGTIAQYIKKLELSNIDFKLIPALEWYITSVAFHILKDEKSQANAMAKYNDSIKNL